MPHRVAEVLAFLEREVREPAFRAAVELADSRDPEAVLEAAPDVRAHAVAVRDADGVRAV